MRTEKVYNYSTSILATSQQTDQPNGTERTKKSRSPIALSVFNAKHAAVCVESL